MSFRALILVIAGLTVLLVGSVLGFEVWYADRVYPGVSVWGRDVGGMRPGAANPGLETHTRLEESLVTLRGPEQLSWDVRPHDLGLRLEPRVTLDRAYAVGRVARWPERLFTQLELLAFGVDLPPVLIYEQSHSRSYLEALTEELNVAPIDATLSFSGTTPVVQPAQAGRQLDVDASLARLSPVLTRLSPAEVNLVMREMAPTIRDAEPARHEAERLLSDPLTLMLADPREGDPGPWVISPSELVHMLTERAEEGELHVELRREPLQLYLDKLAPALEIEPVDARYHFNDRTGQLEAITESREGRALDVEASVDRIHDGALSGEKHVSLVVQAIAPQYPDDATAQELGIVELVATGESYFIGSPTGRDHNIRLAAGKFDGLVIPPGETFSFNQHLGEVTAEAGYDESFITAGEQLEMGVGGGICQVSTTVFRAAFWGGYPITERWYHSQRVGYYELRGGEVGMDATVYSPHVDFKFINDRSAPLLIEAEVQEGAHRLVFRFYSTDDGREVEKEGPVVTDETEPGSPIYELDEDLAPGTVTKWQSAVGGLTATIERWVYDSAGDVLHHDTFVSKYEPRRAAYHHGPGYEPPGEQTEP